MKQNDYVLFRLSVFTALIYILGGIVSSYLAYLVIRDSMLEQNSQNLEAILKSRATLVEDYLQVSQDQVSFLSRNDMLIQATKTLTRGYAKLNQDFDPIEYSRGNLDAELKQFYKNELKFLALGDDESKQLEQTYLPRSESGRLAQWIYLVKNPNTKGLRNELFTSPHVSAYETAHNRFHPKLNNFLKTFNFRDIFLLDMVGNLVYSTHKEIDFATNLLTGPYASSGLGIAYRGAMASNKRDVVTADFETYIPSSLEPAAFISSPVFDGEQLIGAVVFQISSKKLNAVISDLHGLGNSTETYIVGDDLFMRTDSRFSETSTILRQKVETIASREMFLGRSGSALIKDYRGVAVFSHYRPLQIEGLNWGIIAEVDQSEISAPTLILVRNTLAVFALTLGIIAFVSFITLQTYVIRPLKQLLISADEIIQGNYSARVNVISKDEFSVLAESQNQMARAVQTHLMDLENSLAEVKELKGLLPICASCKSIRDDDGFFRTVETYLVGKSKIEFSHTICNDCLPHLYPELDGILKK